MRCLEVSDSEEEEEALYDQPCAVQDRFFKGDIVVGDLNTRIGYGFVCACDGEAWTW